MNVTQYTALLQDPSKCRFKAAPLSLVALLLI